MMKEQLLSGSLTLPYYTWALSRVDKMTANNSFDCSYSGSWIDKTFWTMINQSSDNTNALGAPGVINPYEIPMSTGHNYLVGSGGVWCLTPINRCMIDIQSQKYPSADALTECDGSILKDYTEWADGIKFDSLEDYYSRKFYSVFNYTSGDNIFTIPSINLESGEKVSNWFVNFWLEVPGDAVWCDR